ncbi:MAG: glycosyltransferase [Anaerolineae bacterium]
MHLQDELSHKSARIWSDVQAEQTAPPKPKIREWGLEGGDTTEQGSLKKKAAHYRYLLAKQAYDTVEKRASTQFAAHAYIEEATKVHTFGNKEIGIYAPFVLARSAIRTIYKRQVAVIALIGLLIGIALVLNLSLTLTVLMGGVTAFYFCNLLLTLYLSIRVFEKSNEVEIPDEVVTQLDDAIWPRYTILCPLYKEAAVVKQFADAMLKMDYPVERLQIMFLTESDDEGTREAIRAANLPPHFEIVTVPDGQPRTKPRACNYGLLYATGDYVVIYDAEDVPDPLQMKKAVLAFLENGSDIGCVQAKLNFYNSRQNILTRWFTVEYSTWFDATLPGLQWAQFALPLGGTSNHFKLSTLRGIGAWDAYNVTEDCDLGLRLASQGYRTLVLDSTTLEEANPNLKNWIRQRSRWIKGYMQTYLIYMRQPFNYLNPFKPYDLISMQIIIGGRTAVLLINPIMWVMVAIYFAFRSIPGVVGVYEMLFPGMVLYFAVLCLIFGNLTYIYTHFIGCLKRNDFGLVKWTLVMPIYWAFASYAAFKALYQLITKPHYWEKTNHGLHLSHAATTSTENEVGAENQTVAAVPVSDHVENNVASPTSAWIINDEERPRSRIRGNTNKLVESKILAWDTEALHAIPAFAPNGANGYANSSPHVEDSVPHRSKTGENWTTKLSRIAVAQKWLLATFVTSCVVGIAATIYFFLNGDLLIYKDASSHLGIARLLFDNTRPGLAHLGGVWLPLPHLLMAPFSAVESLWRTGLAGACISMPSYVLTSVFIFLGARRLTKNDLASFVGALVFILNPNVLYLQSTPLTESLAAVTITAACYYFLAWTQEDKPKHLILMALATFLATLSRYDGWSLAAGFTVLVPIVSLLKQRNRFRAEANTIVFVLIGSLGIIIWILWCWVILGDPLYWQRSEYSSQAQQAHLILSNQAYTYHDVFQSIRYFSVLTAITIGPAAFALSVVGLLVYLFQRKISIASLAGAAFLIPFAFYIFSLYSGQAVVYMPEIVPADSPYQIFNTRFGMVGVPPAAIFIAVLIAFISAKLPGILQRLKLGNRPLYRYGFAAACSFMIVGQSVAVSNYGITSLEDGQFGHSCQPNQTIVDYLSEYYDGGKILLDTYVNSRLYLMGPVAGVNFRDIVYQGTGSIWERALRDPASVVDWVVAVPGSEDDKVAKAIDLDGLLFNAQFTLIMKDKWDLALYRRSDLPEPERHPMRSGSGFNNPLCTGTS